MEWVGPVVGVLATVGAGLFTVWVARKKGLPALNKEIEDRLQKLNQTLEDQLAASERSIKELTNKFDACSKDLHDAMEDNGRLRKRVVLAEADLVRLYRGQGARPPRRLTAKDRLDD